MLTGDPDNDKFFDVLEPEEARDLISIVSIRRAIANIIIDLNALESSIWARVKSRFPAQSPLRSAPPPSLSLEVLTTQVRRVSKKRQSACGSSSSRPSRSRSSE